VRRILEDAAAGRIAADPDAERIGAYYRTYLDSARADSLGIAPLRPALDGIGALRRVDDLPEHFARLQRIGVGVPFSVAIWMDLKNSTRYVAYLDQSGLGLPDREYYLDSSDAMAEARAAYTRYATTLLRLAGHRDADAAARRAVALEVRLAERQWERARTRDLVASYNPHTLAQLDSLTPGTFSWSRYVRAAGITAAPALVVGQPDYVQALGRTIAETPVGTWRDYLSIRLLDEYAAELSAPFVEARFAFRGRALQGLEAHRPRWQRAVIATEQAMGEAVGRLYVQRHFRPEDKTRMLRLVDNVVSAFRQGIEELDWMTPETKARAREKLDRFAIKVGYPDTWRDYSALVVHPGDLVDNRQRATAFWYEYYLQRLGKPVDRSEWFSDAQTVNAFYSGSMNEIVFPAGFLQPPFFDPAADDAVNYGAIGAVIGHEIGHGFDDQGRQMDGDGNLRGWWTEADAKAYEARGDRLVAQYDSLSPLPGTHVDGRLTLGENIGDLSGLMMAHRAYRLSLGGREAPVLGGLTGDQRFFIGYAQGRRSKWRDKALREMLLTDPHAPDEYRTNQVLKNVPAFYAAFGVRPGDGMYLPPEQRVRIW
jgi:predicted metalloendopeptidase